MSYFHLYKLGHNALVLFIGQRENVLFGSLIYQSPVYKIYVNVKVHFSLLYVDVVFIEYSGY